MALARCETCRLPEPPARAYPHWHIPVGHPNRSVMCGRAGCTKPAFIWLTTSEQKYYLSGQRIFRYSSYAPAAQLA